MVKLKLHLTEVLLTSSMEVTIELFHWSNTNKITNSDAAIIYLYIFIIHHGLWRTIANFRLRCILTLDKMEFSEEKTFLYSSTIFYRWILINFFLDAEPRSSLCRQRNVLEKVILLKNRLLIIFQFIWSGSFVCDLYTYTKQTLPNGIWYLHFVNVESLTWLLINTQCSIIKRNDTSRCCELNWQAKQLPLNASTSGSDKTDLFDSPKDILHVYPFDGFTKRPNNLGTIFLG